MRKQLEFKVPRIHIMSKFMKEYKPLEQKFIKEYGKIDKESYCIEKDKRLVGFGRALAVATLLYDNDSVGNCGGNMGYIID